MTTSLEYWNPQNKSVVTESGFRYRDTSSALTKIVEVEYKDNIDLFEQFYKLNNSLRYCNGSFYEFKDDEFHKLYLEWLQSDDYKKKSFNLYYGNGIVD